MHHSAPTHEQVLLEIKRGDPNDANLTDVQFIPWRSLVFLVVSVPLLLTLIRYSHLPFAILIVIWVAGPILLPLFELAAQSHYLTPTSLVRRYGIAGQKRRMFALADIVQVEVVDLAGFGTGTLLIRVTDRTIRITEVRDAEAVAQAILVAKSRVPVSSD